MNTLLGLGDELVAPGGLEAAIPAAHCTSFGVWSSDTVLVDWDEEPFAGGPVAPTFDMVLSWVTSIVDEIVECFQQAIANPRL